jgi:hypothetical protein
VFFNPYRCWYKRNFTTQNPPDLIYIDAEAIEAILAHVRFNEEGQIVEIPSWETVQNLVSISKSQQKNEPRSPILKDNFEMRAEAIVQ